VFEDLGAEPLIDTSDLAKARELSLERVPLETRLAFVTKSS
jgi:hypothetical protein